MKKAQKAQEFSAGVLWLDEHNKGGGDKPWHAMSLYTADLHQENLKTCAWSVARYFTCICNMSGSLQQQGDAILLLTASSADDS